MSNKKTSVVCTLFEGGYHYGLAALTNSLYQNGFCGEIFAGFKGELPEWSNNAKENPALKWTGAKTLVVAQDLELHFLPLETDYHLTNYKPDFMLDLLAGPAKQADALFYADPDLVFDAPWDIFENWVRAGVAVCEDVNSPLAQYHPRRVTWRSYLQQGGINLVFKEPYYANGGFVGVNSQDSSFLKLWKKIQESMGAFIGGLHQSSLQGIPLPKQHAEPLSPFSKTDQDALNCAIEATDLAVSFMGKEAMGFRSGLALLPHALGTPKPWVWPFFKQTLRGIPPSGSNKCYWKYANAVIKPYSAIELKFKFLQLKLASLIGRFYKRN